jgi:hypothetical protein
VGKVADLYWSLASLAHPVNEDQTSQTLLPNLTRAFVGVFFVCLPFISLAAIFDRYRLGHWWGLDYIISLGIPLLVLPSAVCLMFVPRRIRWSTAEFEIQPRFGRTRTLPWAQLYAYGTGNNVFLLRFTDVPTFQIFAAAFDRNQWRSFRDFLATKHLDKRASFWLGPKAIRK